MPLNIFKNVLMICLCLIGFITLMFALVNFALFVSYMPATSQTINMPHAKEKDAHREFVLTASSYMMNGCLLCMFALQHSVLASPKVKQFISQWVGEAERSVYIISTAASILLLCSKWHTNPWSLWHFESSWVHVVCMVVHTVMWLSIYGGSLKMDLPEMIGIKQVYYKLRNNPQPLSLKTPEVRRLYGHMRHPSFICFSVLFWFRPYMTVDRLLLAVGLTLYMLCAWNVDKEDYFYHQEQLQVKKIQLSRNR